MNKNSLLLFNNYFILLILYDLKAFHFSISISYNDQDQLSSKFE